jgi:HD superfamily phosphohydrolase
MDAKVPKRYCDALYGDIELNESVATLAATPAVQRLRFIRLSNIDSLAMPGIANISRYEHALGAAYLASELGFIKRLPIRDAAVLQAAALLHDSAIAPFGHLVEEGLAYVGVAFNHETKWLHLIENPRGAELGGAETQVFAGRESGLRRWATATFAEASRERLFEIVELVSGRGRWGACIAGAIDVDNLDNLVRIAFHMGIPVDRALPLRVVQAATSFDNDGPMFDPAVAHDIETWSQLRQLVYTRLMLAPSDLCLKIMMLYAIVHAYEHGDLSPEEFVWTLTDDQLIERLTESGSQQVRQTVLAWMTGELWPLAEPIWLVGHAPSYAQVGEFAKHISSTVIGRECFAYRIADKRVRSITLRLTSGATLATGAAPTRWLLGVASHAQKPFTQPENRKIVSAAEEFFHTSRTAAGLGDGRDATPLLENA